MGLFGRKRTASNRVAEGGGGISDGQGDDAAPSGGGAPSPVDKPPRKGGGESLELFGDDSDESDDDAAIARCLDGVDGGNGDDAADAESRKLSPEELFVKYDTDGSGSISFAEFVAMLPELGINVSEAKALRIFRKCDTDGGGEIDLTEFKMAMFTVDPVSGNALGFSPSNLLNPRDVFDLFDGDGTGKIDELEFADVLEYFDMDVSDAKQEQLFKKYDKDKSGYIDYKEFRSMWLQLTNVGEELKKRGMEIPKYATPWKLQKLLEAALEEEEAREALVIAEAEKFREQEREKERRELLGRRAIIRAEDELAAALDAAGQVYVIGCGKYEQFAGKPVARDEDLFPGFREVSSLWSSRVDPSAAILRKQSTPAKRQQSQKNQVSSPTSTSVVPLGTKSPSSQTKRSGVSTASAGAAPLEIRSKYVRRRLENKRWKFGSPPRVNKQTFRSLKRLVRSTREQAEAKLGELPVSESPESSAMVPETSDVEPIGDEDAKTDDDDGTYGNEELALLFFEDREFVRSLRFRKTSLMTNTGSLWGRSVVQGTITESVAYTVTTDGSVYTWGGRTSRWEAPTLPTIGFDSELDAIMPDNGGDNSQGGDNCQDLKKGGESANDTANPAVGPKITARSALLKMATPDQLVGVVDPDVKFREEDARAAQARQEEENQHYERLKRVVKYYDVWEPPPSNATRVLFMQHVLLPKLTYETLLASTQIRGLVFDRITKMDLILVLAECFEIEVELKGEAGHLELKKAETRIKEYSLDKQKLLLVQPERDKFLESWKDLKELREQRQREKEARKHDEAAAKIRRADEAFETRAARRHVQLENTTIEYTVRGQNYKIDMSGITSRGPLLHSPRGGAAVAMVAAGSHHVALLMQNGLLYTCGIGASGRLGLQPNEFGASCFDSDHPQLIDTLKSTSIRQVSSAYSHSAAIDSDGFLYTWGSATSGKLGVGVVEEQYEQYALLPLLVKFPRKRRIRCVSCGASHTGAVSTVGELFMWGSANGGRLGLGAGVTDMVTVPTLVREFVTKQVRVWQVSCGTAHSACTSEVISEQNGGSKKLLGGQVFICGGPMALGKHIPTWEHVKALSEVAIRQVSCGTNHTGAVSAYGELYTWGRNRRGCTGHGVKREFIEQPELLKCFHVEPYNLALGKPCRQISIYNEQGPELAVNGVIDGSLEKCIHTHLEDQPWWEVDLGQPAVIEKIRVWNRTDEPQNPARSRAEYTARLSPFWIFVSEFPFKAFEGKEGLRAAKVQSSAFERFVENKRLTEWALPTAHTVGQFVRIQLASDRAFLHVAEVEVFGVYSAFKYVGRVGSVTCSNETTMVIVPPEPHQSALDEYYLRAVQADADNATILRQFPAYERPYRAFGREGDTNAPTAAASDVHHDTIVTSRNANCRLCRVIRACEICDFYAHTKALQGQPPTRAVGDRLGLKDLVKLAIETATLEEETRQLEQPTENKEQEQQHEPTDQPTKKSSLLLSAIARRWTVKPR